MRLVSPITRGEFSTTQLVTGSALQGMKGGLKVSADQSADETIALAAMTIKNSMAGTSAHRE